ncbi:hypothetical protein [Streptomyces sp. S5]|uniref:hypothetical protein n=1 Tax=Streptomyces sp. S5 TaxID=1456735 RepID=UPI0013CEA5A0|nr:hypothetical protein [Streptomyces sp. S5]
MTEQQMRQFVAHDLRSVPVAGSRDVEDVVLGIEAEDHPAGSVDSTCFRQLMKMEGTAALHSELPAYFVHSVGIR